jgi:hypothetical protein
MRCHFVAAIAIAMIITGVLSARSDEIPTLDVRPVCHGIASQGADPLDVGIQTSFQQCVQSEQQVREQLKKEWSTFSAANKQHCVALATIGGESSFTELITCLEMARDVRLIRSAGATGAATTRDLSSPPTPTVQPPPADSASPAASANQPPKTEADSMLKELNQAKADAKQAKADAQNARTSEAMAQRKLADTETDLKRTKDEAGQATKEAQRAKADAQAARKSQADAENKLADANAARVAAEGREQACQSTSLGARLRSWFGREPSNP